MTTTAVTGDGPPREIVHGDDRDNEQAEKPAKKKAAKSTTKKSAEE